MVTVVGAVVTIAPPADQPVNCDLLVIPNLTPFSFGAGLLTKVASNHLTILKVHEFLRQSYSAVSRCLPTSAITDHVFPVVKAVHNKVSTLETNLRKKVTAPARMYVGKYLGLTSPRQQSHKRQCKLLREEGLGKESATSFVRDPSQHLPGVISGNHGKPNSKQADTNLGTRKVQLTQCRKLGKRGGNQSIDPPPHSHNSFAHANSTGCITIHLANVRLAAYKAGVVTSPFWPHQKDENNNLISLGFKKSFYTVYIWRRPVAGLHVMPVEVEVNKLIKDTLMKPTKKLWCEGGGDNWLQRKKKSKFYQEAIGGKNLPAAR
ncbi:hypothetical protein PR048_009593 [Dryococelus australis]|uniref:Uncharacterized protein n=1 Tax=Dryococelus australis TaxID=614101 RepID=A0ABQ9I0A4_9NEOP|nr:hypothetical protein PR048_009593 [Dryococelus australis]